jgi:hypothetical protein
MWVLILNNDLHNNCEEIAENYSAIINKYWLSKKDIFWIIDAKWKQSYDKTNKFLSIFNEYFFGNEVNKYYYMDELYNTRYIKDYLMYLNKNEAIYWNEEQSGFVWKFFITIFTVIKSIFRLKWNDWSVKVWTFLYKMIFLIIFIILFLRIYDYYFTNNNIGDDTIKSKIQNIININNN